MNILADESVDSSIVAELRARGHHVIYVAECEPGLADDDVLSRATAAQAVLLTADKDFGELVFRQRRASGGVVLLRLKGLLAETKGQIVGEFLADHEPRLAAGFAVIAPGKLRIRSEGPGG
jgi:predicted nuclease of predicted toxin-antitoxin system